MIILFLLLAFMGNWHHSGCLSTKRCSGQRCGREVFTEPAGVSSVLYIVGPAAQLQASPGATGRLLISIRSLDPSWKYFYITWHFVSGNRPILVFIVEQCQGAAHRWWEPPCQIKCDVAQEYEPRADVAPQSGSLVLQGLRAEDTGTYRVTVSGPQGEASADVNLTVTDVVSRAARGGFSIGNAVRLGVGSLVLCLLGLIVAEAEFPHQTTSPIMPHPTCLYSVTSSWQGLRTQREPSPIHQQGTHSSWPPSTYSG